LVSVLCSTLTGEPSIALQRHSPPASAGACPHCSVRATGWYPRRGVRSMPGALYMCNAPAELSSSHPGGII